MSYGADIDVEHIIKISQPYFSIQYQMCSAPVYEGIWTRPGAQSKRSIRAPNNYVNLCKAFNREDVTVDKPANQGRRKLLRMGFYGLAAVPLTRLAAGDIAAAEDLPKLALDDPQAKALSYHHDAGKAEADTRKQGQYCHNCNLYAGEGKAQWGKCNIFPGKLVNRDGWCSAYVKG